DLHGDLELADLAVLDSSAHLTHLEPVEVAQRVVRTPDGVAHGLLHRILRRPDDLRDAVHLALVGHTSLPSPRADDNRWPEDENCRNGASSRVDPGVVPRGR